LKFLTNAGSPDPVMTRHLWAAVFEIDAGAAPRVAADDTVATTSTATTASAPTAVTMSHGRLGDPAERDMGM
jgi:hypothetical protein